MTDLPKPKDLGVPDDPALLPLQVEWTGGRRRVGGVVPPRGSPSCLRPRLTGPPRTVRRCRPRRRDTDVTTNGGPGTTSVIIPDRPSSGTPVTARLHRALKRKRNSKRRPLQRTPPTGPRPTRVSLSVSTGGPPGTTGDGDLPGTPPCHPGCLVCRDPRPRGAGQVCLREQVPPACHQRVQGSVVGVTGTTPYSHRRPRRSTGGPVRVRNPPRPVPRHSTPDPVGVFPGEGLPRPRPP